ncbi:MAG TPA: ABC transporter permease subunit, partial [Rubrivivax sp.]|nr:ABC transporter permease subunit [Rubrivivax sp.]
EMGRDYVTASRIAGAGRLRLMFDTVLPNCMAPLIVNATLSFSSAILETAALGFLGLGVQPPLPEWGSMLSAARDYIERAPWVVTLPGLLLAIGVITILGPGLTNTVIAIAVGALPGYVRLVRGSALAEMGRDYVTASRIAGAGQLRLMFDTVLPNCMAPLIVNATLSFSSAILETAALGFLGLGVQPPLPEWGSMLSAARDYIERAPWVVTLPGLTILVTVLAINLMGDGLRDVLDPKLRSA